MTRKPDLFTCDTCGKPWAFRSREDAVRAHRDLKYREKMGMCCCND